MSSPLICVDVYCTSFPVFQSKTPRRSIEVGKLADIIAVDGDPLTNITALERIKFVMKKGLIVKYEISN